MTQAELAGARWADDGGPTPAAALERRTGRVNLPAETAVTAPVTHMPHYPGPLELLYSRHTLLATGRTHGDSRLVHLAILERLAANRRIAEAQGWTSLALERVAGMGQLRLWGVPATAERREVVPDWAPR